jgi:Tol biopolymer transport system component
VKQNLSIITLICFVLTLLSCTKTGTFEINDLPFEGVVVYVEDLSGKNGLLANPFGDLVMLDGDSNTKQIITNDGFYYAYPNLSPDQKSIIFESKRDRGINISGLGARSNLYEYHLETNEIHNYWDIIYDKTGFELGERMKAPSLSPSGQKLAMIHTHYGNSNFMAIDFENKEIFQITNDSRQKPLVQSNISWSPNEEYLLFEPSNFSRRPVLLFDFNTSELTSIIHPNYDTLEGDKSYFCKSGAWIDNSSFYFSCSTPPAQKTQIFRYSLNDNVSTEVMLVEQTSVKSLQTNDSGDQILFIGGKEGIHDDLYMLKVESKELVRITHDDRQKGWLRWYPNN